MDKKVLLVDDETDFLTLMSRVVESWGYEVETAASADEAMECVRNGDVNALVLDYLMPDIDGVELLRKIRKIDANVPAVMFTAHPSIKAVEGGKGLGIAAFIPKMSPYVDTQADLKIALDLICR